MAAVRSPLRSPISSAVRSALADRRSFTPSAFNPANLFAGGISGGFWDFTDPVSLWSDVARTVPATLNGKVQGVTDLSGNGRHLSTATATILRRTGFTEFPGGVVGFATTDGQTGSAAGWSAGLAVRPAAVGPTYQWMDADQAGLRVAQPFGHDVSTFGGGFVNGGNQFISGAAPVAGADLVVVDTLSTTTLTFRVNKLASAPLVYAAGVPASNAASKIGLGSGWTNTATQNQRIVTGRIYAALFINKVLTAQEIADLENWLYAKAGLL